MTVETILSGLRSINNRDPLNIYHIARELWCVNDFLYFVSLTLAWVAFQDALRGMPIPTNEIHRPHNLNHMLQQLQTLDVSDYRKNLMKIYILLKIVALILHMTLTKVPSRAIPFVYRKEVGEASPEKLKELFEWFKCTQKSLRINDCENMAKMKVTGHEYLSNCDLIVRLFRSENCLNLRYTPFSITNCSNQRSIKAIQERRGSANQVGDGVSILFLREIFSVHKFLLVMLTNKEFLRFYCKSQELLIIFFFLFNVVHYLANINPIPH